MWPSFSAPNFPALRLRDLVGFGSKLHGKVRYMALGDYANSRGAADMGLLPDRAAPATRKRCQDPAMTAPQMVEAAQSGKLKALYVVGANPLAHFGTLGYGRGKTELLIVHELFMTETAKQADIIFPAASAYEKDGTVTNTSGEVQLLHKAAEVMGPRTDFDLLRILSHQLEKQGLGKAFHCKNRRRGLRRNSQDRSRLRSRTGRLAHRRRRIRARRKSAATAARRMTFRSA